VAKTKTVTVNRRARRDYEILEAYEAGLALEGSEIKAIREGRANLSDGYGAPRDGELWLENVHIARYSSSASRESHEPKRPRKLLLHKREIEYLARSVSHKGLTIVPLRLYFKAGWAKVELGLARGLKRYDKRRVIIEREREREARAALGRRQREG
jgi:SsrA-binding protein